jgi:hypothetical protein
MKKRKMKLVKRTTVAETQIIGIVHSVETDDPSGILESTWFWRLVAYNGEVLAHSEGYDKASDRNKTARRVALQLGVEVIKGSR